MELDVLFMITCVITARFFEKKKMRAAAVLYSVMFISILSVFLFAVDIPVIKTALTNMLGGGVYSEIRMYMLEAVGMTFCGVSMVGVIGLTFAVQLAVIVIHTTRRVVRCFIKKTPARRFKKAYLKLASTVRSLYLPRRINLLYCRMLN